MDAAANTAALNVVTGDAREPQRVADTLLAMGYPHEDSTTHMVDFVAVCSAVVHTRRLESLHIMGRSPQRAVCWRWLGFALHSQYSASSIYELLLDDGLLALEDVKMFNDTSPTAFRDSTKTDPLLELCCEPYPDHVDADSIVHRVQLDPQTEVARFGETIGALCDLQVSKHTHFMVLNENLDRGDEPSMLVLIPGFGPCPVPCESVLNASPFRLDSSAKTQIERLRLYFDRIEKMALSGFSSCFGSSLVRLELEVRDRPDLPDADITALLAGCPRLQYLHLNKISLDSMDPFTKGFKTHKCRLSVLNLWNVFVNPANMKRFAHEMTNPKSPISSRLREFRFMCEDIDKSTGKCPQIITSECAELFSIAAQRSSPLTTLEIGLVRSVYDEWASKLGDCDKAEVSKRWRRIKPAFLSVADGGNPTRKKTKTAPRNSIRLPAKYRRRLATRIFEFIRPPTNRVVNAIGVPRSEFE